MSWKRQPLFFIARTMKATYVLFIIAFLISCNETGNNNAVKDSVVLNYNVIPAERKSVSPAAVKTHSETVKSFETTDEFKVSIFETKETFHYLIKIYYKNLAEEDTLKVPNFGIQPAVEIKKGEKHPSCIVGFLDQDKQFRESKLIYFEDNTIKVHVLKHYAVATYQK